mgnify:CR=1 FL=1
MQYVCESTKGRTWFRIETDAEAEAETTLMRHAVEKHFRREQARARKSYVPGQGLERDIARLRGQIHEHDVTIGEKERRTLEVVLHLPISDRDLFLSNTVRTHRKLRQAGVTAELHVYEGQSHAQYLANADAPETREVFQEIGQFFDKHLGK